MYTPMYIYASIENEIDVYMCTYVYTYARTYVRR